MNPDPPAALEDDEPAPASTRVLRVRRMGDAYVVYGGDVALSEPLPTKEEALARARAETTARGALILVESDAGLEAEAIPPSSNKS